MSITDSSHEEHRIAALVDGHQPRDRPQYARFATTCAVTVGTVLVGNVDGTVVGGTVADVTNTNLGHASLAKTTLTGTRFTGVNLDRFIGYEPQNASLQVSTHHHNFSTIIVRPWK